MKRHLVSIAMLAVAMLASPAFAACDNCGSVTDVKTVKKEDRGQKSTTTYVVTVKLENGATRTFNYGAPTAYKVGDRVKIIDKKLVRQ
jgi:predicted S18 family serine protease